MNLEIILDIILVESVVLFRDIFDIILVDSILFRDIGIYRIYFNIN